MANTRFKLNTGAEIPALGLGTWQSGTGEVGEAVSHALSVGYKHIDCAYVYQNEAEVGQAFRDAFAKGVKREDIFITTKLWCTYHSRVEEALDKSLKDLGLDYVDLYLIHWPLAMNPNGNHDLVPSLPDGSCDLAKDWSHVQTWKSMEKLMDTGKVRAIGVSNYSVRSLEELLPHVQIIPAVNQIENHPSLPQQDVVDLCKAKGIHITAYSPLGSTGCPMMQEPKVVELAKKKGVTPAAILLSYHVARGSSVLAKSVTKERIKENLDSIVDLDSEDMTLLNEYSSQLGKDGKFKRYIFPSFGVDFGFPDKA
ncbi:D-galacturonate reductase [Podosphaera aphanis]|nr:D-galacturonate reductase [Podosphaera aphanis]